MRLHALIPIDFAAENEKKTLFSHENMDVMLSNYLNHYMNKQIPGCLSFKVTPQLLKGKMNLEIKKKYFSKKILNQNISFKATCSLVKVLPTPPY